MKIAFLTEMGFTGKIPKEHPNMRTEFAWMHALDADHYNIHSPIEGYDVVFVIFPKGMVFLNAVGGKLSNEKYCNTCLQFRDWGRIGDNSEAMSDRFNHSVDGIPYDYKFLYGVLGYNMKSSEMNAAFGLVQLERFGEFEKIRRNNIERYLENLKDVEEILLPDDSIKPNWLAIPLQTEKRYELLHFLEDNNIQTRVTFAGNVTRHPIYREYLQPFQNSDTIMKNGFLLGAHHGMTIEDVDYVCDKIKEFFSK